jgi:predicted AAA+ superfamily ATPase
LTPTQASNEIFNYIDNISEVDFRNIKERPSKQRTLALINALSRNIATEASYETLAKEADIFDSNNKISTKTTRKYLDLLTQAFILDELKA